MSESEEDFVCSQISKSDYFSSQSAFYGGDVIDGEGVNSVVSLENTDETRFDIGVENFIQSQSQRILYDNVVIEDISLDEEDDKV